MIHNLIPLAHTSVLRWLVGALASTVLSGAGFALQCSEQGPLQNHTDPSFTPCPCFVAGEHFGVVLNIPAVHLPAEILRVRIFAASGVGGGQTDVLGQSLNIYGAGLPNPGVPIASLAGPVLSDMVQNEFNLEVLMGGAVPIAANPFTVTFEFASDNVNNLFTPTAVYDIDGCTPGSNVIYAIPGGWSDACSLGVPGDWAISVIYRPLNCDSNQTYCVSSANSVGSGAQIGYVGSSSFAANDFILTCTGLPTGQPGLFYYGPNQIQLPFGNGFRCVGGTVTRLIPPAVADIFGNVSRVLDYSQPPLNSGPGMITAGSTYNFQYWYRDPASGGAFFNLSNALNVIFTP